MSYEEERLHIELAARKAEEERRVAERQAASPAKKVRNIEAGFGVDYNVEHLARQPILTYQQIEEQFGIRISGFGRGINKTSSTVVLISSVDKKKTGFVYHDHWTTAGEYIYSGEGKTGDQIMSSGNIAIVNAADEGKDIQLFVKFSPQEYYYQGVFELVNYTYEDDRSSARTSATLAVVSAARILGDKFPRIDRPAAPAAASFKKSRRFIRLLLGSHSNTAFTHRPVVRGY